MTVVGARRGTYSIIKRHDKNETHAGAMAYEKMKAKHATDTNEERVKAILEKVRLAAGEEKDPRMRTHMVEEKPSPRPFWRR